MSGETRMGWIDRQAGLALARQCELAGVARATFYGRQAPSEECEEDLLLCRLIDEEYTRRPFYGSRRMVVYLARQGHAVNRKRVQRLMRLMGLAGMAPGPSTSVKHPEHRVYPYLLRGIAVTRPNHVWSTDITYIRLARGFVYLVAIIDWYSRRVLAWRISNSMDTSFCVDCLEDALSLHGKPEIFNTDQGSQFTSAAFTGVLQRAGIAISMDGRGRALDNIFVERLWRSVKHEDVSEGIRHGGRADARAGGIFRVLQRRAPAPIAGQPHAERSLCRWQWRRGEYPRPFRQCAGRIPCSARCAGDSPRATTGQRCSAAIEAMDAA